MKEQATQDMLTADEKLLLYMVSCLVGQALRVSRTDGWNGSFGEFALQARNTQQGLHYFESFWGGGREARGVPGGGSDDGGEKEKETESA